MSTIVKGNRPMTAINVFTASRGIVASVLTIVVRSIKTRVPSRERAWQRNILRLLEQPQSSLSAQIYGPSGDEP